MCSEDLLLNNFKTNIGGSSVVPTSQARTSATLLLPKSVQRFEACNMRTDISIKKHEHPSMRSFIQIVQRVTVRTNLYG
jgi:hypothetical protein